MEKLFLAAVLLLAYVAHYADSRPAVITEYVEADRQGTDEELRREDRLMAAIRHFIRERREVLPLLEMDVASDIEPVFEDVSPSEEEEEAFPPSKDVKSSRVLSFADRGGWGGGYGR